MTLKQIAEALNVSPSTVSRVLHGYHKNFSVTPEMRERILKMVEESGYRANPVFSSIRTKKNRQISVLFYDASFFKVCGSVSASISDVMSELLTQRGYSLNYSFCQTARKECYALPLWKVAGLVIPDVTDAAQLKFIEDAELPYVAVNGVCGANGAAVISDEVANTRILVEHLLAFGHRRILFVHRRRMAEFRHYSVEERENAFIALMREKKLPELPIINCNSDERIAELFQLVRRSGATAIVAYDTDLVVRLLHGAWQHGIRIPQDLCMVAYNDPEEARYYNPPLTRLHIPVEEIGRTAVELLCARLEKGVALAAETMRIAGFLVEGESVAAPAGNTGSVV